MKIKDMDYLCFDCISINDINMNPKITANVYGATCDNCKSFKSCISSGYIKEKRDIDLILEKKILEEKKPKFKKDILD